MCRTYSVDISLNWQRQLLYVCAWVCLYAKDQWDDFFPYFFFCSRGKNIYLRFIYRESFFRFFCIASNVTSFCDTAIFLSIDRNMPILRASNTESSNNGFNGPNRRISKIAIAAATMETKWEKSSNVRDERTRKWCESICASENHWIVHSLVYW